MQRTVQPMRVSPSDVRLQLEISVLRILQSLPYDSIPFKSLRYQRYPLKASIQVAWCSCAGTCEFKSGGGCIIRLSEPILKLRPPEDLKNTLIHEMIHAYIFLKRIPGAGNDGHGPPFKDRMKKINDSTVPDFHRPAEGYRITVYHTMIDEVRHYQQHWWECERCGLPRFQLLAFASIAHITLHALVVQHSSYSVCDYIDWVQM